MGQYTNYDSWNKAKRLEDIEESRRKPLAEGTDCEHDYEDLDNTFYRGGWLAYKQCRLCGAYLFTKKRD